MAATTARARPLACVPGAIAPEERAAHFALARHLFARLAEAREPLANGYRFRFAPEALTAVAQFVSNERKCCPFVQFDISVTPEGPVVLRMSGPEGTRAVLDAELGLDACSNQGCGCHGT